MKKKFEVTIVRTVEVELDTTKFTKKVMDDFEEVIFKLDGLDGHCQHIAQLAARFDDSICGMKFVEGYGRAYDAGIEARVINEECEVEEV